MTGSTSTNVRQSSNRGDGAARLEALSWLAAQIHWERRLGEIKEANAISQATGGTPAEVAAFASMGHDRDDLDVGAGVTHGMEAAGRIA
jgi:hypothetical protein